MAKRYYWLKLKEDFFRQKAIKKLRKIAGGDTFTIIYLKMQLLSLKENGKLFYEGVEENFCEELALEIDEDIDNVTLTVGYLIKHGLLTEVEHDEYLLPETVSSIGSETAGAERQRKYAAKKKALENEKKKALNEGVSENDAPMTNGDTTVISSDTEQRRAEQSREKQELEKEQQQEIELTYFEVLKNDFTIVEVEELEKYFIKNNIAAAVVKEKLEVVKSKRGIKNRVGALKAAIRDNWELGKALTEEVNPMSFNNFEAREYDYDALENKLLGWDKEGC